jgi:hypothetical protein
VSGADGDGTTIPLAVIFHPPLLFVVRTSGGIGYRSWYSAHGSTTVRLPRPKPFAERTFFWEDDIAEMTHEITFVRYWRMRLEMGS